MMVSAIVAVSENNVIGRDGDLPWRLPTDTRFFMETTMGHHVIVGRKNYESIPEKFRPLPGRTNILITRNKELSIDGVEISHSLEDALAIAKEANDDEPFIIGGGQIYALAFEQNLIDRLYLTRVHADVEGDVLFPEVDLGSWVLKTQTFYPGDEKHAHSFSIQLWEKGL